MFTAQDVVMIKNETRVIFCDKIIFGEQTFENIDVFAHWYGSMSVVSILPTARDINGEPPIVTYIKRPDCC